VEGTVAADGDDAVQTQELAGRDSLPLAFFRSEFLAAGSIQNGAAAVDDVADALFVQLDDITINKAVVASANTVALHAVEHGCTHDGTDTGIHTRRVTAAGQDTDSFNAHSSFLHAGLFCIILVLFLSKVKENFQICWQQSSVFDRMSFICSECQIYCAFFVEFATADVDILT
jgi:hypothetical protein